VAEAEEGSGGVVQACHVVAEGGLRFDVLRQRVSGVLLAVDVEENDNLARDKLLKEAHAPRDVNARRLTDEASACEGDRVAKLSAMRLLVNERGVIDNARRHPLQIPPPQLRGPCQSVGSLVSYKSLCIVRCHAQGLRAGVEGEQYM